MVCGQREQQINKPRTHTGVWRGCTDHHQGVVAEGVGRARENRLEMGKDFLRSTYKLRNEGLRGFSQTGQRLAA